MFLLHSALSRIGYMYVKKCRYFMEVECLPHIDARFLGFFFLQYRISLNTFCIPQQRLLCLTHYFFSEAFQRSFLPKNDL